MTTAILIAAGTLIAGLIAVVIAQTGSMVKSHRGEIEAKDKLVPLQNEILSLKESLDKANAQRDTLTQALQAKADELSREQAARKRLEDAHRALVDKLAHSGAASGLINDELKLLQNLSKA